MNSKQAVRDALNHIENKRVPFHFDICQGAYKNLLKYASEKGIELDLNNDICSNEFWGYPTELPDRPEYFMDMFGVIWNRSGADKDIGIPDNIVVEDLEEFDYIFPEIDEVKLREGCEALVKNANGRFTVQDFGFCMFERAWALRGMENILADMIISPEAVEEFFEKICDFQCKLLDIILEYDIDMILFGDDWGQQSGLIMGPANWRRFIKPHMAKMYAKVKAKGKYAAQHSCGDCREIMEDLIEIGLDCYQTLQPEIYDLDEIKKQCGDRLTFWGGISTQRCLPYMTENELKNEVVRVIKALKPGGGLIIAPTHAIPNDVPPQNILAMLEVFINQDKYLNL